VRHLNRTMFGIVIAAAATVVSFAQAPSGTTVFEGARVIVGDGRAPIDNAMIVVSDGKIAQVGRAADVKAPAGAMRVNLAGKTVMPTIVDTHVHTSQERDALAQDLRRRAYYGVGAAMSLGQDTGEAPFQIRAQPIAGAARFFTAGRGITAPEPGRTNAPYWIQSADEARKAVQELAKQKVDIVKIWVDDRDGKYKKLTPDLYGAVIDEAHKNKLRVTAHLFTLEDAKGLWKAGIDAFAHGVRDRDIDEEFLAMVKKRPAFVLVPNLPDRGVKTDLSWLKGSLSAGELQKLEAANTDRPDAQTQFGIQARNLSKMSAAGVRVALGSDGNTPWAPHVEMADMVAAGMTPMQVIVAATGAAAQVSKLDHVGTIAPGKAADLLVLDANPLQDILNTRKIHSVWIGGHRMGATGTN
jgi:imidazolonepropionase-like amidohydrolase